MTYARRQRPQARCRICKHPLYSRSELPDTIDAMCFPCLADHPAYKGLVFQRVEAVRWAAA